MSHAPLGRRTLVVLGILWALIPLLLVVAGYVAWRSMLDQQPAIVVAAHALVLGLALAIIYLAIVGVRFWGEVAASRR